MAVSRIRRVPVCLLSANRALHRGCRREDVGDDEKKGATRPSGPLYACEPVHPGAGGGDCRRHLQPNTDIGDNTLTVPTNSKLEVPSDKALTLETGVNVFVDQAGTLNADGTVTTNEISNSGTIDVSGTLAADNFTNNGTVTVSSNQTLARKLLACSLT